MNKRLQMDVGTTDDWVSTADDEIIDDAAGEVVTALATAGPSPQLLATRRPIPPARLRRLLVLSDAAALSLGLVVATAAQRWLRPVPSSIVVAHLKLAAVVVPVWLLVMGLNRLFTARTLARRAEEFRRILQANAVGTGLLVAAGFALQFEQLSRLWVLLVLLWTTLTLTVSRSVARHVFAWMREQGYSSRPVVIVGTGVDGLSVLHTTLRHPELGYRVVGMAGDDVGERGGVQVLGPTDDTLEIIRDTGAIGAILSVPSLQPHEVNVLTRQLTKAGHHVTLSPALHDIDIARTRPQEIDGRLMIYVEPTGLAGWRRVCKRVFDVIVAGLVLVLTSPLIAVAALAIKLTSPGHVFFSQVRVGRDGKEFRIWKLRTMVADAEARLPEVADLNEADGALFKITRDPRVTSVGRLLRKTSIDELPQLWNVLRGEMSIVGPRPALPSETKKWTPELRERLHVLPGITGMWQVSGRSDADFEQYKRLDLYYVDNWSLWRDLSIVARTFGVVVFGKGAR